MEEDATRQTLDFDIARRRLGMGRSAAYEAARRGEFPVTLIRVGRRYLVSTAALNRLLEVETTGTSGRTD